jgi:hypothetical protein
MDDRRPTDAPAQEAASEPQAPGLSADAVMRRRACGLLGLGFFLLGAVVCGVLVLFTVYLAGRLLGAW